MSFALLTLAFSCARPAQAQGRWSVTDAANNPLPNGGSGYSLTGTATGAATNTYPQDMTAAALAPPYYSQYGLVDNSQWLQAASGGPHSYDPNPLGAPYLYNGGTTGPSGTSIALNATAHNYALDNRYYGSFNPDAPPFFTNQMYQNPSDCEPINGTVTGRATGTLWAYWNWTGPGSPPDHLDILLTTNVQASKSYENGSEGTNLTASATASDGDPFNETATSDGPVQSVVGRHLLRVPVSNGVASVSLNGNVKASATNQIPYGGFGGQYYQNDYSGNNPTGAKSIASVSATADIDSRDVSIHSNLGQTNHASFTFDGNGFALPEPDPPGFATTVVPYLDSADVGGTTGVTGGTIRYIATPAGSWGPNSSYRWQSRIGNMYTSTQSPNGTFTLPNDPPYDLILTYLSKKDGGNVSAGDTEHITITLTDSSNGDALSAPYDVAFHDPTEDWELWDKGNPFWQGATADSVADPGYALHNAGITATWTYTDTFWAEAGEAFTAVGGHMVESPYWAGLIEAASIAFSKVQPQQVQQAVNFNDAWTDSNSTFDPQPPDSTQATMTQYKMVPELYVRYQRQFWRGYAYGASGYTGGVETAFDKYLASDTAGDFTLAASDPTGG